MIALLVAAFVSLGPGVEYGEFRLADAPAMGDGLLHVVRVDVSKAELRMGLALRDGGTRTAGQWADKLHFAAVVNLGMFEKDGLTATGHVRDGQYVLTRRWNGYRSALAFGPSGAEFFDLDAPGAQARAETFPSVAQSLRLLKAPGEDMWQKAPASKRWSEAAIGEDKDGRILFLFSRTPFSMHELNQKLLALPLGIVRAMHVEGGPEASLSVRGPSLKLDLAGSYETGFHEDDKNDRQWPLPNVLGVVAPAPSPKQ
jgi:hypothetical protein